jgi:hypothetical protein
VARVFEKHPNLRSRALPSRRGRTPSPYARQLDVLR